MSRSDNLPDLSDPATATTRKAWLLVDVLAAAGVRHACICPGSRSAPLTLGFLAHPSVHTWRLIDERSAGFFALGITKAIRAPVAVVCTSGTAAANLFPAVVEARYGHLPLLVLTADRPPELRDTGALQTIDQVKLYGDYVNWFAELVSLPDPAGTEPYVRQIALRAVQMAGGEPPGPVHINIPLREPLVPSRWPESPPRDPTLTPGVTSSVKHADESTVHRVLHDLRSTPRSLIVCGPQDDPDLAAPLAELARAAGCPILADPLSQIRFGPHDRGLVVDNYDVLLRGPIAVERLAPRLALRLGLSPTSKSLLAFLDRCPECRQVSISAGGLPNDPGRSVHEIIDAGPSSMVGALVERFKAREPDRIGPFDQQRDDEWTETWLTLSRRCRVMTDAVFAASDSLSEPKVFDQLAAILPDNALIFVGNSMPIRDLDAFFPSRSAPLRVLANRGVNGIDGVISSALGAAAGCGSRVVLVLGDLSFYHDMNGLLAAKLHQIDATIILLNNDGGGIFHFLPQADPVRVPPATFEDYFVMPTGLDFGPAVEMYGGRLRRPTSWDGFRRAVETSFSEPGLTVIEVRTDRSANVALHQAVWSAAEGVDALSSD